ncbi:betaine--homocysteine S-methyltransferase 1-like isoform X2 [Glandiceps talaboti]
MSTKVKGLVERVSNGEKIIVAEGYIFLFERRGYLKAGPFVPEVVLEHPDLVKNAYREFAHAGSDVVLAFTFYANRAKMRLIGRENDIQKMNNDALRMAREVADETGTLMAGNISNSNIYTPTNSAEKNDTIRDMFKEQIEWAVDAGSDFILAETFMHLGEAEMALKVAQKFGKDLPVVVTMSAFATEIIDGQYCTSDKVPFGEACQKLYDAGATVVGLNCAFGPETMVVALQQIRQTYNGPLAAVPVPFRTTDKEPSFSTLTDPINGEALFPTNLEVVSCSRTDIENFAEKCKKLNVQFIGLCCGNEACLTRTLAEQLGRVTPASRFSPEMSKHCVFGTDDAVDKQNKEHVRGIIDKMKSGSS